MAVSAWLEKLSDGRYSSQIEEELKLFEVWGAVGKTSPARGTGIP